MGSSPVRLSDEDKRNLELLRHEVTRASGRQPAQQEILGKAVEFAMRHKDEFLRETAWKPLSPAAARKWLAKSYPLGSWSAEDIDTVVYGDEA